MTDGMMVRRDWTTYLSSTGEPIPRNWANFTAGLIPIEELDDDELAREQLRNVNGNFASRPPSAVPRALRKRLQSELQRRLVVRIQERSFDSIKAFTDVLDDTSADHKDRMKAGQYLLERVIGKVPDKVEVTAEVKPWEGVVSGIIHDIEEVDDAVTGELGSGQE